MEENKALIKKEDFPVLFPTARALFKSGLFLQTKNEFGAYAIIEYGFELGIPPMTALQTMAIISGKICMAGQMMLSIALRNGLEYKILKDGTEECQVYLKFKNNEYTSSFTIAEAKQAGVYRQDSGWTKYPKDMLFWRAVTRGLRRVCPDLILGLYAKEELEGAPSFDATIVEENQEREVGEQKKDRKEEAPPPSPQTNQGLGQLDPEVSANYLIEVLKHMDGYENLFQLQNGYKKHFHEWSDNLTPEDMKKVAVMKDAMKMKFGEVKP